MQGLNMFTVFSYAQFLEGKRLVFLKARPWLDNGQELGSKVTIQIVEDKTQYGKPNITNFGELLTVKVRNLPPSAFAQLKPLSTEIFIKDVEKATVYGEYRNQLSIIAAIAVKETPNK